jgi:hypothetical protein
MLVTGSNVHGFKPGQGGRILRVIKGPQNAFLQRGKYSRWPHVVRFYGMLKNPLKYERNIL